MPSYRYVTGTKARGDQWDGEWVCKYGATTRYGCGQIVDRFFQGWGYYSDNSFVRIHSFDDPGTPLSWGGDSGGPFFNGGTAYGMMHGNFFPGDGSVDAIYMPINYVQYTGLTVLVNCPWWGC